MNGVILKLFETEPRREKERERTNEKLYAAKACRARAKYEYLECGIANRKSILQQPATCYVFSSTSRPESEHEKNKQKTQNMCLNDFK